ncbi:unnamed protein product [Cladocopium goreaui]|uniref:Thiol protease n=1 Tax=Cladocopium goreaui TaxID=2562237 RepID=A0A9P1GM28_9DINO|nr:unnamed protein product [Cladocopium goreaui]
MRKFPESTGFRGLAKPDFSKRDDVLLNGFGRPDTLILAQGHRFYAHYEALIRFGEERFTSEAKAPSLGQILVRSKCSGTDVGQDPAERRTAEGVLAWLHAVYPPQAEILHHPGSFGLDLGILTLLLPLISAEREKQLSQEDDETAYKRFREEHNRTSTGDQLSYEQRLANFRRFRAAVEEHNARPDVSWTAVINRFADYSEAEYRALLGQRRTWRPEVKAGQDHYCIM